MQPPRQQIDRLHNQPMQCLGCAPLSYRLRCGQLQTGCGIWWPTLEGSWFNAAMISFVCSQFCIRSASHCSTMHTASRTHMHTPGKSARKPRDCFSRGACVVGMTRSWTLMAREHPPTHYYNQQPVPQARAHTCSRHTRSGHMRTSLRAPSIDDRKSTSRFLSPAAPVTSRRPRGDARMMSES